jgi:hypothetical protein
MSTLASLVLVWLVTLQNPNDPALAGIMTPEWAASYVDTAQEIAAAAERAPFRRGDVEYPEFTAAILVVNAYRESHFNPHPCTKTWNCDGGASLGKFQLWRGWKDESADMALWLMHKSLVVCSKRPVSERLGWYLRGGSGCENRLEMSDSRMRAAKALVLQVPGAKALF